MAAITVGFSIPEEDRPRLERLVRRFGDGNRSAFLREAIRQMEVIDRAERLAELQAYGSERLEEARLSPEDVPAVVKRVLGGRASGRKPPRAPRRRKA